MMIMPSGSKNHTFNRVLGVNVDCLDPLGYGTLRVQVPKYDGIGAPKAMVSIVFGTVYSSV